MNPIQSWVDAAVQEAMLSHCQSKRGVVIVDQAGNLLASGHNHQPFPFQCNGSDRCKKNCGKTAVHAEQAAILSTRMEFLPGTSMLHVKAECGSALASMAPSCLECSKLILESGIGWMHLLHEPSARSGWKSCEMIVQRMNEILDWIEQGVYLSETDMRAWLKELIAQCKRNLATSADNVEVLTKRIAELEAALIISQALVDALETCHICQGTLALDDVEPTHCLDCSWDCDEHDEPACEPLFSLHGKVKAAIRKALEAK